MNDDPDFDLEGPDIEWVSYGLPLDGPISLLLIAAVGLIVFTIFAILYS